MVFAKNKNLESICANVGVPEKGRYLKARRLFARLGISKSGGSVFTASLPRVWFCCCFFFLHVLQMLFKIYLDSSVSSNIIYCILVSKERMTFSSFLLKLS